MAQYSTALVVIAFLVSPAMVLAEQYIVGDSGWEFGVDLNAWAGSKTFYTGDVLSE